MKEDSSRRICVQLLQTLNILFENMTNQTAIYYLLSNNHTNAIITHRFDFTDEEVVAYCISFLKILSFRLNINTISFFYIELKRLFRHASLVVTTCGGVIRLPYSSECLGQAHS
ncbi:Protein CLEC16A [Schistosoma japonicum]|nr:Protein CLEC16A [Schistosoma japonicum]